MSTLERLKELQAAATPGPWDRDGLYNVLRIAKKSLDWELVNPTEDASMPDEDDAEFIVALHEALPAMIEVAEAAKVVKETYSAVVSDPVASDIDAEFGCLADAWNRLDAALAKLEKEG